MLDARGDSLFSVWERHGGITSQLRILMPICEFVGMCDAGWWLVFFLSELTLNSCSYLPLPASPMHVHTFLFLLLATLGS